MDDGTGGRCRPAPRPGLQAHLSVTPEEIRPGQMCVVAVIAALFTAVTAVVVVAATVIDARPVNRSVRASPGKTWLGSDGNRLGASLACCAVRGAGHGRARRRVAMTRVILRANSLCRQIFCHLIAGEDAPACQAGVSGGPARSLLSGSLRHDLDNQEPDRR